MLYPVKTMQSSPSGPKFASNIRFETKAEFNRNCPPILKQDLLYLSDSPFRSRGWDRYIAVNQDLRERYQDEAQCSPWDSDSIRKQRDIYTGTAITGTAGGITDRHSGVRFHLLPESTNLDDVQLPCSPTLSNSLNPQIPSGQSKLKQQLLANKACLEPNGQSALLLGGNVNLEQYKQGCRLVFDQLLNTLRATNLDPSFFWGQDSRKSNKGTKAYYTGHDDTWHIYKPKPGKPFSPFKTMIYSQLGRFGWSPTLEPVSTIQDLKDSFSEIHLGKGDTLYLGSNPQGITAPELEQALYQLDHPSTALNPTPGTSALSNPFVGQSVNTDSASPLPASGAINNANIIVPNRSSISSLKPSQKAGVNF